MLHTRHVACLIVYQWHQNRLRNNYYDNDDNETKIKVTLINKIKNNLFTYGSLQPTPQYNLVEFWIAVERVLHRKLLVGLLSLVSNI